MKRTALIIAAAFISMVAFAGKGIVVEQTYASPNGINASVTVTWYITETQCKMQMRFGDNTVKTTTFFLPDLNTSSLLMYTEGEVPKGVQKTFFSTPVEKIQQDKTMDATKPVVTKTGETKELGGFTCEKVIIKTEKTETEAWITKSFSPAFYKFYSYFRNNYVLMGLSEAKLTGFPLSSVTKDANGKVLNSYTLVSAKKEELGDDVFKVPAEYQPVKK